MRGDRYVLWALGALALITIPLTLASHLTFAVLGQGKGSWNPVVLALQLAQGGTGLSGRGLIVLAVVTLSFYALAFAIGLGVYVARTPRQRGDEAARLAGTKATTQAIREKKVRAKADKFGLDSTHRPGYPIGRAVADGGAIFADFEAVATVIAGPRTGKTTAIAVPIILSTRGPVLATSNKRDIVDATMFVRKERTREPVWVFDPSSIRKQVATCFWNPLEFVRDQDHYDGSIVSRASRLSAIMGDAARSTDGKGTYSAFWDGGGDRIRGQLIAAAALGGYTMSDVYAWASAEVDTRPVEILHDAGLAIMAKSLESAINLPHETRGGMWACARQGLEWVEDPSFNQWWQPDDRRTEFEPHEFVTTCQTLYSLSRDESQATPLVAALTAVTCLAAEFQAEARGGRLALPMMVVLDEAANVCPWRDLPKLYSHFGSKGICLVTILQSWSQGSDVWGETGMAKLWSASNIALYAGGVKETSALENFSKMIGVHYVDQHSTSTTQGVTSYSNAVESQERPIARVDELAALPEWRAWLFATHARPLMIELVPWFKTSDQQAVAQSLKRALA